MASKRKRKTKGAVHKATGRLYSVSFHVFPGTSGSTTIRAENAGDAEAEVRTRYPDAASVQASGPLPE